jgi:hypothetical protein
VVTSKTNARHTESEASMIVENISQEQLDEVVRLLNQEIQWCYQNPMKYAITEEFHKGFIKGIEQAKYLIIHMYTQIVYASE